MKLAPTNLWEALNKHVDGKLHDKISEWVKGIEPTGETKQFSPVNLTEEAYFTLATAHSAKSPFRDEIQAFRKLHPEFSESAIAQSIGRVASRIKGFTPVVKPTKQPKVQPKVHNGLGLPEEVSSSQFLYGNSPANRPGTVEVDVNVSDNGSLSFQIKPLTPKHLATLIEDFPDQRDGMRVKSTDEGITVTIPEIKNKYLQCVGANLSDSYRKANLGVPKLIALNFSQPIIKPHGIGHFRTTAHHQRFLEATGKIKPANQPQNALITDQLTEIRQALLEKWSGEIGKDHEVAVPILQGDEQPDKVTLQVTEALHDAGWSTQIIGHPEYLLFIHARDLNPRGEKLAIETPSQVRALQLQNTQEIS